MKNHNSSNRKKYHSSNQNNQEFIDNMNFNNLNNEEFNEDFRNMEMNEFESSHNFLESFSEINAYDKNISLLKEKIKEQEKNIIYLNNRLENYDLTMKEITNLNIELNALNEIIRNKNKTIQEFRNISDLSKKKFEELLKNNGNLLCNINKLKEENKKLKNISKNNSSDNKLKEELKMIKKENEKLKKEINEKNEEINNLNQIINDLKNKNDFNQNPNREKDILNYKNRNISNEIINSINPYANEPIKVNKKFHRNKYIKKYHSLINKKKLLEGRYTPSNINTNIGFNYHHNHRNSNYLINKNLSARTEPNYGNSIPFNNLRRDLKAKNNYSIKSSHMEPLDFSNYLLDNLKDKICKNFIK